MVAIVRLDMLLKMMNATFLRSLLFAAFTCLTISAAAQTGADAVFKQQQDCSRLLQKGLFTDAEASCRSLVSLADKLPPGEQLQRLTAYRLLGHAYYGQKKFGDALTAYQQELKIAETALHSPDAELGYAYHDVARALLGLGDFQHSQFYYDKAVTRWNRHGNILIPNS